MSDAGHSSLAEDGVNCISNLPTHQSPVFQRLCDIEWVFLLNRALDVLQKLGLEPEMHLSA